MGGCPSRPCRPWCMTFCWPMARSRNPGCRAARRSVFGRAERDWVYALKFSARPGRVSRLRFLGLDGRAEVYLNGDRVASHSDEHAPLTVEVSQTLRPENSLVLRFRSNAGRSEKGAPETGLQLPTAVIWAPIRRWRRSESSTRYGWKLPTATRWTRRRPVYRWTSR